MKELERELNKAFKKLTQPINKKVYIVGGIKCKLIKQGNKWIRKEL